VKNNALIHSDTIAAIATPSGNGGVGIIRISGALAFEIASKLLQKTLSPRRAVYANFLDDKGELIDSGIALYFPAPHSYTGESVLELQGHGGSVILDMLLERVLALGARLAQAGEFTQRAFLNGKLDLTQAEAVADLISSRTRQSVRSAQKSLKGIFSERIDALVEELTELRVYVEASIDFVDEEIDFLTDGIIEKRLLNLIERLNEIQNTAQQGQLLRDGMSVVLAGKPNAGKSSLLNALAGSDVAIVSEIAGTTRDLLREQIQLDGMPLHIIDTAGLRETDNSVEQEGIRRAHLEMKKADKILLLIDICHGEPEQSEFESDALIATLPKESEIIRVYNKIDLIDLSPRIEKKGRDTAIFISTKTGKGLDLLKKYLKESMGFNSDAEDVFIARRRHLDSLVHAKGFVLQALQQLQNNAAGELVAEDLRGAQQSLWEITGEFNADDLLGKIFSSFCIGK
jgi:tRNA modification GTPase